MKKKISNTKKAQIHELHDFPDDLREVWELSEPSKNTPPIVSEEETEEALSHVLDELDLEDKRVNYPGIVRLLSIAATVLFAALVGFLSFYTTSHQATYGEKLSVVLPDGSNVTLNGNSSISYSPLFNYFNRSVDMQGEVYFDVVSSSTPFTVKSPSTKVTVYGTKFNVTDWDNATFINPTISVTEGKVGVYDFVNNEVLLTANEQATLLDKSGGFLKSQINEANYIPKWLSGELEFQNVTLSYLFERLELHFGKEIQTSGTSFEDEYIYVQYKQSSTLEDILSDVSVVKELNVEKTHDGYIISE